MLTASGFLGPGLPAQGNVLEASAFNSSGTLKDSGVIAASSHEETRYVIPLGTTFGIKLFTDGVIVASLSDIYTETGLCCPAAEAGLRPGDYLLEADSKLLESNTDLARIIGASEGRELRLKVRREDEVFETSVTPVYGDGSFKTGMWVRDSAAGIGTLTFYDPKTGIFAGLGHGICD
ncbi:MAG: SpoIVB peptidase S55 domain-containing protein, partial [Neglectibacter sp.]